MVKVITYGTYDVLHYGHIRLLERAKALGDYLIVGITSDDYDKTRGKINNQQSLMERVAAVKDTGIADEIGLDADVCIPLREIILHGSDLLYQFLIFCHVELLPFYIEFRLICLCHGNTDLQVFPAAFHR